MGESLHSRVNDQAMQPTTVDIDQNWKGTGRIRRRVNIQEETVFARPCTVKQHEGARRILPLRTYRTELVGLDHRVAICLWGLRRLPSVRTRRRSRKTYAKSSISAS